MDAGTLAREITQKSIAPVASKNDRERQFNTEAIKALGEAGLLGLLVPTTQGGKGQGPRQFADVVATIAEADPSVAMVYVMHVCGTACIVSAPQTETTKAVLKDIVAGKHLTTLAFSEAGSRSHFWAPVSKAQKTPHGVKLDASKSWVTSATHADSFVASALAPDGKGPTDSTLYLVRKGQKGLSVAGSFEGLGLTGNDSAPMKLEGVEIAEDARLTPDGTGFKAMLEVVLPLFNLGSAALALGICRATVAATVAHLKNAKFEHLGSASLGEALPNLRAQLANMQNDADGLAARIDDVIKHLETPGDLTVLRVLQSKAVAGDVAIKVTSEAMRTCGGAAFSKHTSIERFFRDAHAGAVMAPTVDVLKEFIGKALLGIPLF
jgi:alkylation response protein AidB-like acyl-CoA dehydrogenase